MGYQVAFNCAISQAFVCAVYVLFAVNERQSGAKHMQQIAGVKPLAYWGASLLWDWISYLTVIFSILTLLYWHGDPGYSSMKQMGEFFFEEIIKFRITILYHKYILTYQKYRKFEWLSTITTILVSKFSFEIFFFYVYHILSYVHVNMYWCWTI